MVTVSNPFEGRGFGQILPLAKVEAKTGRFVCAAVSAPGQPRCWMEVPVGTRVVPDYGVRFFGLISFAPTISELAVLDGSPPPEVPADGRQWQAFLAVPMLIEGRHELFKFGCTGDINQRRIVGLIDQWKLAPEAQNGQLREYKTHAFERVTTQYGDYFALVWEPVAWVDRDPAIFGPRLIDPPLRHLGMAAAPARLAANDSVPPQPQPQSPAAPKAAAPPPPADPMARYRPVGAGQKPF